MGASAQNRRWVGYIANHTGRKTHYKSFNKHAPAFKHVFNTLRHEYGLNVTEEDEFVETVPRNFMLMVNGEMGIVRLV